MKNKFIQSKAVTRATVISLVIAAGIFLSGIVAKAVASSTNTQVTVTYYTGQPSSAISYEKAYAEGDSAVGEVTYTTKSCGRLQWGKPDEKGQYEVYYDASDVHELASSLNVSEEEYLKLYEKYVEAYKAVNE